MTPKELENSILQRAIQGRLVTQNDSDIPIDISLIKKRPIDEFEFDLPSNWVLAHLESVAALIPSKKYQVLESQVLKEGVYPVISQSKEYSIGFSNDEEKVFRHNIPVIVFGDHTTEIKVIDFDFVVGADGVKIFLPNSFLVPKYLYYVMKYRCIDLKKIGGYSRHYKYLKNKPIPIPPISEQKRIVEKIEELLPLIERYRAAWTKIDEANKRFPIDMQKSILQMAFQGKLVEQRASEGTGKEFVKVSSYTVKNKPINDELPPFDVPESWEWVKFYSVVQIATNLVQPTEFQDYIHIAPDNIEKGTGKLGECHTVAEDKVISSNHRFFEGQIIYSKIRPLLKKAVIAPFDGLCSADMYPLNTNLYTPFLFYYILSDAFNIQVAVAMSSRVKMPKINQKELERIWIPIPPLAEQKRIVDKIEVLLPYCDRLQKYNQ